MTFLSILWFGLAALLLALYAAADGFDLGAGIIYGLTKDKESKARILASIAPVWSGNEVWVLAGLGSLLAAFPPVFSALLSILYVPVMLVIVAILFRAIGVELRPKTDSAFLQGIFDFMIPFGSAVTAWAIGLVAGNVLVGMPMDQAGNLSGSWLFFLHPFALVTSLVSLVALTLHGTLYVAMKTDGSQAQALAEAGQRLLLILAGLALVAAVYGALILGPRFAASKALLGFGLFSVLALLGYGGVFMDLKAKRIAGAFWASFIGVVSTAGGLACLLFPVLIPSRINHAWDLTVASTANSEKSLLVMLIIALVGVPLIAVYTFVAYRSFRGKAKASGH